MFSDELHCCTCNATSQRLFHLAESLAIELIPPELAPRLAASLPQLVAGLPRAVIPPPLWMKKRGQIFMKL